MGVYSVDLDQLDDRIARMTRFADRVDQRLADLDAEIATLHHTWSGLAADAQRRAHAEWTSGAREMRAALVALREAAAVARRNYAHATESNLAMWNDVG